MKIKLTTRLTILGFGLLSLGSAIVNAEAPQQILIKNAQIFNGIDNQLTPGDLLVEGQLIKQIGTNLSASDAVVIDAAGRTLMPGMIDGHAHVMINAHFNTVEKDMDLTDLALRAQLVSERFILDGFTTVRDMGGPAFGLARNIDAGIVVGPRLYPSGGFISQTSGHGDFRDRADPGFSIQDAGDLSNFERMGIGSVANGVPEVLAATRLNLRNGATQIKIMAGGGGSSRFDPMDTSQFTYDEIKAIVDAAADWNTYVAAHVFTDRSVNRLLDAGVKTFEHSFFISDETMQRIAEEGGYCVPQMWGLSPDLAKNPLMPANKLPMLDELQKAYGDYGERLLKNGVKVVFASDYVGVFADAERARRYELWWRTQAFKSNFEVLKQATSTAGEMLAMSGPRNPYKAGKLGVIEEGAYADILLVDGNPLEDISVVGGTPAWFDADPEYKLIPTIHLVMKDGDIYRNDIDGRLSQKAVKYAGQMKYEGIIESPGAPF
ncbi:metal-dependent hydrolase family protein [Coraliomargarita akajimensis]|uniref:Amidohydrolase n=1 Tax=Coraliomargarita akajimensis (strain DSM 45221 / IAM 15411 / JCM 23193 / KCTC 12865 / 04OKA010-24) TaxID=583355 RepID=D5EPC9_CORAD|nr:amidohydrolase family protein [Coraliomargarita akajimensis]ADE55639.1 amidohydrolase [Coraliomargarita akajimensis DSM 45221]